jgi:transcription factor C subunit 6
MSRSLRPRASRPNYASLNAGDASAAPDLSCGALDDGESDFAPNADEEAARASEDEPDFEPDDDYEAPPVSAVPSSSKPLAKGKGRGKGKTKAVEPSPAPDGAPPTGVDSAAPRRQIYNLPQPSVNHRHKAIPIFRGLADAERLVRTPVRFGANAITRTNAFASSARVTDRLSKALGYNIGPGPLWELCEDRGWFKEARARNGDVGEAKRRPRVYGGVEVHSGWVVLDVQCVVRSSLDVCHIMLLARPYRDTTPYLPVAETIAAGGSSHLERMVCDLGPFGKQTAVEMKTLDSFAMCKHTSISSTLSMYSSCRHYSGPFSRQRVTCILRWCTGSFSRLVSHLHRRQAS